MGSLVSIIQNMIFTIDSYENTFASLLNADDILEQIDQLSRVNWPPFFSMMKLPIRRIFTIEKIVKQVFGKDEYQEKRTGI